MLRLALCFTFALAAGLPAQDKPPVPPPAKGPTLTAGSARLQGEVLTYEVTITKYAQETRTETRIVGGMAVTQNVTVNVPVLVIESRQLSLKGLQAYQVGAKADDPTKRLTLLDPTKLTALLKEKKQVMFAPPGAKVEAADVKDMKEGTIILVPAKEKPPEKK